MPATPVRRNGAASGRPLRSPLAAPGGPAALPFPPSPSRAGLTDRGATRAEFEDYLRTTNNKFGRPYEEASISAYVCPAKTLDEWMTAKGIEGGYTVVDTALLNRFFREYYREHGQAARTRCSATCSSCSTT